MLASSVIGEQISEAVKAVKARHRPAGTRKGGPPAYEATWLYAEYERVERAAGREPVHPVRFGQEVIRWGGLRKSVWSPKHRQMVRGWMV
jgi:hypothetical protein